MALSTVWKNWVEERIDARRDAGLLRGLQSLEPLSPVHVRRDGRELTLFSSNDYLGLSGDQRVIDGAIEAIERHGMGPRGSPLICGYTTLHQELEQRIAGWKGAESALLCPTGFAANLAVLGGLADDNTTVFSDELNHASIIDGCTLAKRSGALLEIYPHCDVDALDERLEHCSTERAMVVTDSVFSMDGDLAPMNQLAEICERHDALWVIDEAHGSFVFGDNGRGLAESCGVTDDVDIHVGTLSKGAGGLGGFIATTDSMRTMLLNLGRSYVYSTAAPLSVVGGLVAAIDVVESDNSLQQQLWAHVEQLGQGLGVELKSPIVPIVIGPEADAMGASNYLFERGIDVTAIRPPTVRPGTSRLRITVSAAHRREDIAHLVEILDEIDERYGFEVG